MESSDSKFKGAGSPYDEKTEPIANPGRENRPTIFINGEIVNSGGTTEDNTVDTPKEPEVHARTDEVFHNTESLFAPSPNGPPIPLFDPSVVEYARVARMEYTAEELEREIQNHDEPDPLLLRLQEARAALDEKSKPLAKFSKRLMMDGPVRRTLKKERALAEARFNHRRDNYIATKHAAINPENTLATLTIARANLAEATNNARHGSVTGATRGSEEILHRAQKSYNDAERNYCAELLEQRSPSMTLDDELQFISSFKDHERGALAGEEANLYLTEVNDDSKKSLFQKGAERFNKLSRTKKIVSGIAVAAIAGVGFGAIGGAVAIGGVAAVKFARNTLNAESDRIGKYTDSRFQQENSVLHTGNFAQSQQEYQMIRTTTDIQETHDEIYKEHTEAREKAILNESKRLTKEKRRVYGKAAIYSAVPLIGGAVAGALTEHSFHRLSHGMFREHGLFGDDHNYSSQNDAPDTQPTPHPDTDGTTGNPPNTTDRPTPEPSTPAPGAPDTSPEPAPSAPAPDTLPEQSEPAPTPETTPQSEYLYGDYAGKDLSFSLPAGSSVWQEVNNNLSMRHPLLSYTERERLTGNIVALIKAEHPGLNFDTLPAGTFISAKIPA